MCAFVGEVTQLLCRGAASLRQLIRVLVRQLVERKHAAPGDLHRPRQRIRIVGEQQRHLVRGLEAALGVGEQPGADGVDGAAMADTGQHVLQRFAAAHVEVHVVERNQWGQGPRRHRCQL